MLRVTLTVRKEDTVIRRLRTGSTYAGVAATLALVISLGGTAVASFVVSSNADVAPGTIAGHHPPAGKHANIIASSVNTTDLAKNAVTSGKIANHTVQPVDLAPAARGARAYGYFTNVLTRSRNVVSVHNPSDGTYCITLKASINVNSATLIAATEFGADNTSDGGNQVAHAEWRAAAPDCPAGQMEVLTFLDEQKTQVQPVTGCSGCTVDDTYRDLVLTDQGFSFVVP
jgi:hypothetical protein